MRLRRPPLTAIATAVLSAGVLTAALLTTGTAAGAAVAQTARGAQPAGVPCTHVDRGGVLAQYTSAAHEGGKTGPAELYLLSPVDARYQLARWPYFRFAP